MARGNRVVFAISQLWVQIHVPALTNVFVLSVIKINISLKLPKVGLS